MDKFKEGMRLPTLIKQLQKILEQYPDDGQILKELIQNAEDAGVSGATQIKFLIDYSTYGTQTLYQPDLKDFQGPALYVYNDALFTEDDWDGIRSLHESIKEDDPMKVGRFGLGFKSVFHMTDLPSIFSDKGIGSIHPHVRYFEREVEGRSYKEKTSCFLFSLEKDHQTIATLSDQFAPFCQEVFGITKDTLLKDKQFKGTLFRFPFRTERNKEDSEISQTVYDKEKIELLMQSLITDSHNSLLFLKNLERIEVYEKSEKGEIKLKFKVEISDSCRYWVKQQRQDFIKQMGDGKTWTQSNSAVITYPIAFDIIKYSLDGKPIIEPETWWIVTQYFAGQEDAVGNMQQDNKYLPLVGIAQKINFNKNGNSTVFTMQPTGHIFCFLPLPMEQESPTGFRVHVNGSFSVDHNRRHLKWASSDYPVTSIVDKDLLWNIFLVSRVLPNAFKAQLRFMVSIGRRSDDITIPGSFIVALDKEKPGFLSQHIYAIVPEPRIIKSQWKSLVKSVVDELASLAVFYTVTGNGKYLNYKEAIFDVVDENKSAADKALDELLRKILIKDERNIVSLPGYVYKMIPKDNKQTSAVQAVESLKSVQDDLDIRDNEKIKLLDYCFLNSSKIPDLTGVNLLPLADGTWTTFTKQPDVNSLVYLETDQHRQEFLPGLEKRFLKTSGFSANTLMMLKQQRTYQLRELNAKTVSELLPKIFKPEEWPNGSDDLLVPRNHEWFDIDWLDMIWEYLKQHHSKNLNMFENLPIVPITKERVTRLSQNCAIVVKSLRNVGKKEILSNDKIKLCRNLGIKIMEVEDSEILQHPLIWKSYLQPPNDSGIITAMFKLYQSKDIVTLVDHLDAADRAKLRTVLVDATRTLSSPQEIETIKALRVFKSVSQNCHPEIKFLSLRDTQIAMPSQMTLLPLATRVIALDFSDDASRKIATFLGVRVPTRALFIRQVYMPYILTADCTINDKKTFMRYLLDNWNNMSHEDYTECSNLVAIIRNIAFISTKKGSLVRPVDIYDSSINRLKILFSNFDVFAADEFAAPKYSNIMKNFGMKDENLIGNDDVLRIANCILNDTDTKRSEELMAFLNSQLYQRVGQSQHINIDILKYQLWEIRWLATVNSRPDNYPKKLLYATEGKKFASPSEVISSQFVNLVGSVQPVVQTNNFSALSKLFGWISNPSVDFIAQHMCNVIESFSLEEQTTMQSMVRSIYQHLQNNSKDISRFVQCIGNRPWIWNGTGFSTAEQMVLNKSVVDLQPYCYTLPVELCAYSELWKFCNIPRECQLTDILAKIKLHHEYEQAISEDIVERDINLCVQVLKRIAATISPIPETLLVPIKSDDGKLVMREKQVCAYCDAEWYSSGFNLLDLEEDVFLVHESVTPSLCSLLNIDSLASKIIGAESLGYGQTEDLTRRLNSILSGYNDGLAVFKELIQNADDAGAEEIHFLYDERENEDARTILLDKGMTELQGPALWIYNDAQFSEADFKNIAKISSASKEHDTGRVGRFGVGFNVVYNLTDVPMFVSNKYIAIFDPHKTHLGNMIADKSKPGIRLNLQTHRKQIQKYSHQFKPFDKIFKCDFSSASNNSGYPDTLFRLPLRTAKQAERSEICKLVYTRAEVMKLIGLLSKAGHQLLLYTQNLLKISVSHLARNGSPPTDTQLWLTISKQVETIIQNPNPKIPVLKQASQKLLEVSRNPLLINNAVNFEVSTLLKITTDYSPSAPEGLSESERTSYWLVVSCLGQNKSLTLSLQRYGSLIPIGGAAAKLTKTSDNVYQPTSVADGQREGMIFCFMPLPISTTFPIHINGYFEVHSSRTHIYEIVANDKESQRGLWNQALLQDAVARAYVCLLKNLTSLCGSQSCYDLWPSHRSLEEIGFLSNLTEAFYNIVCSENQLQSPCIFNYASGWAQFPECWILETTFREEAIAETALSVLRTLVSKLYASRIKCVDLPVDIQRTILLTSSKELLVKHAVPKDRFFSLFLQNIHNVFSNNRDKLIVYALLDRKILFGLQNIACIPVTPNGTQLKVPIEIIHPRSKLSPLYESDEGRFPCFSHEDFKARTDDIYTALTTIGMKSDDLSWDEIYARCQTVANKPSKASTHTPIIMALIEEKLERGDGTDDWLHTLANVNFIQPLKKLDKSLLKWKGEELAAGQLISLGQGYLECHRNLVSCSCFIIDEASVFGGRHCILTKQIFGLSNKMIALPIVEAQLLCISKMADVNGCIDHIKDSQNIFKIYEDCFKFLNLNVTKNVGAAAELTKLREANVILVEAKGYLLKPYQCALSSSVEVNGLLPYMANISKVALSKYSAIYSHIGVKDQFDFSDFVNLIQTIQQDAKGQPLNAVQLKRAITAIKCICSYAGSSSVVAALQCNSDLFVPNSKGVLCRKSELCYNNSWLNDQRDNYCHLEIPPAYAQILGIRPLQTELMREQKIQSFKFGQREELVNRINRLLDGYLCDVTILKELLQNADDAGATELHFIIDNRQLPQKKVFQDSWKMLQGPALCVYNNTSFKNSDIEGIQKLGEGSKFDDSTKTGQYGVGFNCVYNLTDVPSFLTNAEGTGPALCVFDPNCVYAPDADKQDPGGMYTVSTVLEKFPDVFQGYLQDFKQYNIEKEGTIFRFPLRTRDMLIKSRINGKKIKVSKIKDMLENFMSEMYEMLLFVHNVRSISVKEITNEEGGTGQIETLYKVESNLSTSAQEMLLDFEEYAKDSAKKIRPREDKRKAELSVDEVKFKEITYEMITSDSRNKSDTWQIVHRFGFHNDYKIPHNLIDEIQKGHTKLLPRGGLAYLKKSHSDSTYSSRPMRYFCYLPLPVHVKLPVHINGHFALDNETRRGIWTDASAPLKRQWNISLMEGIIAPAYCSLLTKINSELEETKDGNQEDAKQRIDRYLQIFPNIPIEYNTLLSELTNTIYVTLWKYNMPLLPLRSGAKRANQVKWCGPQGSVSGMQAYFDDLAIQLKDDRPQQSSTYRSSGPSVNVPAQCKEKSLSKAKIIQITLCRCGMYLFACQMNIFANFVKAKQDVLKISPDAVLQFLRNYSFGKHGKFPALPVSIEETPLKDIDSLTELLTYCATDTTYKEKLINLPLLVTYDKMVQTFEATNTKYACDYEDIALHVPNRFIVPAVWKSLNLNPKKDVNLCKLLDVNEFKEILTVTLPIEQFCGENKKIELQLLTDRMKDTPNWLKKVFRFLYDASKLNQLNFCLNTDDRHFYEQEAQQSINRIKEVLSHWCLLPVLFNGCEMLLTVGQAEAIIQPLALSDATSALFKTLQNFGCSVVLLDRLGNSGSRLAQRIVGCIENPKSVAWALDELQKSNAKAFSKVHDLARDSASVLEYFSNNVQKIEKENQTKIKRILKLLPFFETIYHKLVSPKGTQIFVLPSDIPKDGIETWTSSVGVTFLKEKATVDKLYELLGFKKLSVTDVYCQHVFKQFTLFGDSEKQRHLYVLKRYLDNSRSTIIHLEKEIQRVPKEAFERKQNELLKLKSDIEMLKLNLKNLQFVPNLAGTYETASSFFDHTVPVLALIEKKFLPKPYCEDHWMPFMRDCGLIHEISQSSFLRYAKSFEDKSVTDEIRTKSEALLDSFLSRSDLDDDFLCRVRDIKFITPQIVSDNLIQLHPQYADQDAGLIAFNNSTFNDHLMLVWTAQPLLPLSLGSFLRKVEASKRPQICKCLHIDEKATCNSVTEHVKLLCNYLESTNQKTLMSSFHKNLLTEALTAIYEFLQAHIPLDNKLIRKLKYLEFVTIPELPQLVSAEQIVIDMISSDEIRPYLFKIPLEFGRFEKLFLHLGATQVPSPDQYAQVLKLIYKETNDTNVNPNQKQAVGKAISKFFELVSKNNSTVNLYDNLVDFYLPCIDGKLYPSSETIIVDKLDICQRVKLEEIEFEKHIVVNFNEFGVDDTLKLSILARFPEALRPQLMSGIMLEEIVHEEQVQSEFAIRMKQKLECEEFNIGMKCIMQNIAYRISPEQLTSEHEIAMNNVVKINFLAYRTVVTKIRFNGRFLDNSSKDRRYVKEVADGQITYHIRQDFNGNPMFYEDIARISFMSLDEYMSRGSYLVEKLLECKPDEMLGRLNDLSIPVQKDILKPFFAPLGSPIPNRDHCLLIQDILLLWKNQLVALQTDDPMDRGEAGEPTYILVKILEVINESNTHRSNVDHLHLTQKYKIQLSDYGEHYQIVDASWLYAFKSEKNQDKTKWSVVLYEGTSEAPSQERTEPHKDFSSAVRDIKNKLKEIFKVTDEATRKRLIKRLMFEFHPDNNKPEKKDLYTKLFQRLQNFVDMLERGESIDDPANEEEDTKMPDRESDTNSAGFSRPNWFNEDYFRNMNDRARRHNYYNYHHQSRRNRQGGGYNYGYGGRTSYGSGSSGSYYGSRGGTSNSDWNERASQQSLFRSFYTEENKQPGEAMRWLEQARLDLKASANDGSQAIARPAPEWQSYKSYMAAQKCLQAAQYAKDCNKIKIKGSPSELFIANKPTSLSHMCVDLRAPNLESLSAALDTLMTPGGVDKLQYPCMHYTGLPSTNITAEQVEKIHSLAQDIYVASYEFVIQCSDYKN